MVQSRVLKRLPDQFFAQLLQKVVQKVKEGKDVIHLAQGNPDQPTPDFIVQAAKKALDHPKNHHYASFRGNRSYKEAAALFYQKNYNVTLDSQTQIAPLAGSKIGLVELPMCIMNPEDILLLPDPGYPDYLSGVSLAQVTPYFLPLEKENHYLPDYSAIPEDICQKAKVLYLNYPHNPTGAQATKAFFEQTVAFAKKNHIYVVHDFAYGALGNGKKRPLSFLETKGATEVGIECYTLSKTFNMSGWRIAFAAGNETVIEALHTLQDHLFVGLFPVLQKAGEVALTQYTDDIQQLVKRYNKRRHAFVQAAKKINWHAYPSEGTFYAWMPVPKGYTSEQFSDRLLNEVHVAVAPGNGFGKNGEGFVRIGLTVSQKRLVEAVDRIETLHLFES